MDSNGHYSCHECSFGTKRYQFPSHPSHSQGERTGFVTSKGFRHLLEIGNQARPKIFDLAIKKPELLYEEVTEIDERVRVLSEYNTPGFDSKSPPSPLIAHHGEEIMLIR
jgi:5-oxoprolinase (ATP-hydrolysing)